MPLLFRRLFNLILQIQQLILIGFTPRKNKVGELEVNYHHPLFNTQEVVKMWIPMNNPVFRKKAVHVSELLKKARILQLLRREIMQRDSLNVFQEDGRNGPLPHPVSRLHMRVADYLTKHTRNEGALEGLKMPVCVDFVFVVIGLLGVSLL